MTAADGVRFTQVDFDKDGSITCARSTERFRELFQKGRNVPAGHSPRWQGRRVRLPRRVEEHAASALSALPLYVDGLLYTVKDGGLLPCLDAPAAARCSRTSVRPGRGSYYSSPVAGDGKIYPAERTGPAERGEGGTQGRSAGLQRLRGRRLRDPRPSRTGELPPHPRDTCTASACRRRSETIVATNLHEYTAKLW